MARPNFFCGVKTLQALLNYEPKTERDDIDLTVDLIEAPYLFVYTSDEEAWNLKVFGRGELYDHTSGSGVERGNLRVGKASEEGSGSTSDQLLHDNMGAFFGEVDRMHPFKVGVDSCNVPGIIRFCKHILPQSLDTCEGARFSCYIDADMTLLPAALTRSGNMQSA